MKTLTTTDISILDLAKYSPGRTSIAEAFQATRELAQKAEEWGYRRYWLAEHHNIEGVASAATAVLIGHVAQVTKTIRVGSGGIMLPNHSPLVVAEQFGTLETLFPGRIDLGLGRAPGSDQLTIQAVRRNSNSRGEDFAELLEELLYYFEPADPDQRLKAIPGEGVHVPIWILGSSLYSAHLAAKIGRPYSFAGHFAPAAMLQAFEVYRSEFQPSPFCEKPTVMVGVPIVAAETDEQAEFLATTIYQMFLGLVRNDRRISTAPVPSMDSLWSPAEKRAVESMVRMMIVGGPEKVKRGMEELIHLTQADELIITSDLYEQKDRFKSYEIIASIKRGLV